GVGALGQALPAADALPQPASTAGNIGMGRAANSGAGGDGGLVLGVVTGHDGGMSYPGPTPPSDPNDTVTGGPTAPGSLPAVPAIANDPGASGPQDGANFTLDESGS